MATEVARYIVSWVPTRAVEAECRKLGWKADDGTSFWDWIEPEACSQQLEKKTFFEAVFAAKAVLPFDVFREVRIERQELVNDHDDLGNVFASRSWEEVARWSLYDKADVLTEDAPDYRNAA